MSFEIADRTGYLTSKQPSELPDLGKYLALKGTPQKTKFIYTSWEMEVLSVVGLGMYCTSRVQPFDGKLYCATFDFGDEILWEMLKVATTKTQDFIAERLVDDPSSIRHMSLPDPINVGVAAILGEVKQGLNEMFIPLIITEVFG
jgi:hypothetical protein